MAVLLLVKKQLSRKARAIMLLPNMKYRMAWMPVGSEGGTDTQPAVSQWGVTSDSRFSRHDKNTWRPQPVCVLMGCTACCRT